MTDHSDNNTDTWKKSPFAPDESSPQREEKDSSPLEERVLQLAERVEELADRVEEISERVDEAAGEKSEEKVWGRNSPFR